MSDWIWGVPTAVETALRAKLDAAQEEGLTPRHLIVSDTTFRTLARSLGGKSDLDVRMYFLGMIVLPESHVLIADLTRNTTDV